MRAVHVLDQGADALVFGGEAEGLECVLPGGGGEGREHDPGRTSCLRPSGDNGGTNYLMLIVLVRGSRFSLEKASLPGAQAR